MDLLASVTARQLSLAEVFSRDDVVVKRTRVVVVLRAVPRFGPATVAALMAVCGVGQHCWVGELEERQRCWMRSRAHHRLDQREHGPAA